MRCAVSRFERSSDFSIETVPTRIGWPLRVSLFHFLDDLGVLGLGGPVDDIVVILAKHWFVRGQLNDRELVDVSEFVGFGQRRAGHAGQLLVEAEIVLEGDRGEGLVLGLDVDAFFRLDGLVQAFGEAAAFHHAAVELVDQHHLTVLDDIVLVAAVKLVGAQGLVRVVDERDVARLLERTFEEAEFDHPAFHLLGAGFGEDDRALLLVEVEVGRPPGAGSGDRS